MDQLPEADNSTWPVPFSRQDWDQPPAAVQTYLLSVQHGLRQWQDLQERVDALEARLQQNATTAHRPPSSDSPYRKPRLRSAPARPGKVGGTPGHRGHRQCLMPPTTPPTLLPASCPCGGGWETVYVPYYPHQMLERPPIALEVTHWALYQARCAGCGHLHKAQLPPEHATGYGPRLTALMGAIAGIQGNSRRTLQTFCASVLGFSLSLGTIQQVIDRVSLALTPHYERIARCARHAPVNSSDETPWFLSSTLQWLWVMASDTVAVSMIPPRRSKAAFAALIEDWVGILGSDGYGVYQDWGERRQPCLAHRIRTARSLAGRQQPELAACGAWALAEWQRLCQMAKAPPTGGEWRAWYARLCTLLTKYHARQDEAGRFARRLLREMDSLWVFLAQQGVDPTNNRAERALRFGVLWRKRSHGTGSDKGNRWVERILSVRETCRLHGRSTYSVLVDAMSRFFHGLQPDLSWLH